MKAFITVASGAHVPEMTIRFVADNGWEQYRLRGIIAALKSRRPRIFLSFDSPGETRELSVAKDDIEISIEPQLLERIMKMVSQDTMEPIGTPVEVVSNPSD